MGQTKLTDRHIQMRDFVLAFQERQHRVPSYMEIGAALGIGSVHTVYRYMQKLHRAGELVLRYTRLNS